MAARTARRWPGSVAALAISIGVFGMPVADRAGHRRSTAPRTAFFPIGWIVLNAVFLYNLTRASRAVRDRQAVGRAPVGRPADPGAADRVLVRRVHRGRLRASARRWPSRAALLIGLGFTPLYAAGLSLIANTAPVAFGAIGTPILTLAAVTGLPAFTLGAMAGRQLPFVSLIVPAWLVVTMSGWRGLRGVWPAVLVCGGTFAVVQFVWSNYVGPELVDIVGRPRVARRARPLLLPCVEAA